MTVRPVVIFLAVAALVVAGTAAFLARSFLRSQAETVGMEQTAPTPASAEVLVMARDLAAGALLKSDDLRWAQWPLAALDGRVVTRSAQPDMDKNVAGKVIRRPFLAGEPFDPRASFVPGEAGLMAGLLGPGMRAVSVPITANNGVAGFVLPGDRVDVVLTADFRKGNYAPAGNGTVQKYASETVLQDVRVVAIDQQTNPAQDGQSIVGKTATIEVSPKQAEMVATASMIGQLSLVLRSIAEPNGQETLSGPDYTTDLETSRVLKAAMGAAKAPSSGGGRTVTVNRAGTISSQSFGGGK